MVKLYRNTLESTKKQHWRDWLEKAVDPDIWIVNKLIYLQATDRLLEIYTAIYKKKIHYNT